MRLRFHAFVAAMLAGMLLGPCAGMAQQAEEHEVKAAFLFKFPAFVEWPQAGAAKPDGPFVIAVLGADDVASNLRDLAQGRSASGRPIEIRVAKPGDSVAGAHIVFVGRAESARLPQLARSLAGAPTLIASESPGALEQGSMINFITSEGRVRFEVALEPAERSRLRISSRLLSVAQNVRPSRL